MLLVFDDEKESRCIHIGTPLLFQVEHDDILTYLTILVCSMFYPYLHVILLLLFLDDISVLVSSDICGNTNNMPHHRAQYNLYILSYYSINILALRR